MKKSLRSIRDLIRWGASRFNEAGLFYGHGAENAIDEAAYLVLHALHLAPDTSSWWLESRVSGSERKAALQLIQERIQRRVPAAYLTHEAWFAGLPFYVDERVLVPRSPIAELINNGFAPWLGDTEPDTILDLCTGSGCIGIACAHRFPGARVDLADISPDALDVAGENVLSHDLGDRVEVIESDLFESLERRRYQLIVSNPPYVDAAEMATLEPEFQQEPALGLAAGQDGLDIAHRILANAAQHLTEDGILIVEVGASQDALVQACPEWPFTWLEFEQGGSGVFLLTRQQLVDHQPCAPD